MFKLNFVVTVSSPINGHSKRRTTLISGQIFFHRPLPSQNLVKKLSKVDGQLADAIFLHQIAKMPYFLLQLADGPEKWKAI